MLSKSINKENSISFSNSAWRNLIARVCKKIDKTGLGLQIISPFGFELLEDKRFFYKSIKRLYCYIGIPSANVRVCTSAEISKAFSRELMASLFEVGIALSEIAILVVQDKFMLLHEDDYRCCHADKLIDIQTKIIDDDIITDYANYIICTVDSILSKKDEPEHFFENKRHRCRTYQLYIMLENLFGYLLPPMTEFQKKSYYGVFKAIDNSIQMFYTPSELFVNATDYDMHLLNSLIAPRVALMQNAIQAGSSLNELINLQCDAYHVEGKLELLINKNIYENAVEKIRMTYLNCV